MSIPILTIEIALVFLVYPVSLLLVPIRAVWTSKTDRASLWALAFANATLCYGVMRVDELIASTAFLAFITFTMIGAVISFLKRNKPPASTSFGRTFFAIVAGGLTPLLLVFWIGIFNRWPGSVVFGLMGSLWLLCAMQVFLNLPIPGQNLRSSHLRQTCLALVISLGLIVCIALISVFNIKNEAAEVAAGRPYCLEPETDFLNLSILTLRERYHVSGHSLRHHSLLIIDAANGREVFNWSYQKGAFQQLDIEHMDASGRPTIGCQP